MVDKSTVLRGSTTTMTTTTTNAGLVNPMLSNLPAFLVEDGGLHSGFMIAHCTAAACVSESKVLTHPSSVDSISTSAAKPVCFTER